MRTFIIACVTAVVIAVVGVFILNAYQQPVDEAFTSHSNVRLGA